MPQRARLGALLLILPPFGAQVQSKMHFRLPPTNGIRGSIAATRITRTSHKHCLFSMTGGSDESLKPHADEVPADLKSIRQAIYEQLLTFDSRVIRQTLVNHIRECQTPHCPTCSRVRERAIRRRLERKALAMRMSRWRGVAKTIGPLITLRNKAADEMTHAPGDGFDECQAKQSGD